MKHKAGLVAVGLLGAAATIGLLIKMYDLVGHKAMYWVALKGDEIALRRAYHKTWQDQQ